MTTLLVTASHSLDLATTLLLLSLYPITGESNPVAVWAYSFGGPMGLVGLKAAGVAVMLRLIRGSRVRLCVAVLAGLGLALVNAVAWRVWA